ncbi:hypothetical protein BC835DRAFT_1382588 [Cytidiella melzeri]|nr:hypothetical protein BC835DRAFT_1382588 [Cytidiella melzeri]
MVSKLSPRNTIHIRRHINHLPPETLAAIFVALRDSIFAAVECLQPVWKNRVKPRSVRKIYAWTNVLLVNKLWYAVACGWPALWSHIDLARRKYQLRIDRAKKAALTLVCSVPGLIGTPRFFQQDSGVLSHTEQLVIQHTKNWERAFEGITALPMLRDLRLSRKVSPLEYEGPADYDPQDELPEVFTSGDFPKLQRVHLLNYRIDWSYPIFTQNLRTLRIDFTERVDFTDPSLDLAGNFPEPSLRPTFEDTIAALGNMPALEELGLHGCQSTEDNPPIGPQVKLTRLRYLSLYGGVLPCTQFLEAIMFPATTNVALQTIGLLPTLPQLSKLSLVLLEKLSGKHSIGSAMPFQCMLAQEGPQCRRHRGLRFHFLRPDETLGDNQYKNILAHRILWAMDPATVWDPQFKGLQVLFRVWTRRFYPVSYPRDLMPSWVAELCRDWHFICPNITTLVLGPQPYVWHINGGNLDHFVGCQDVNDEDGMKTRSGRLRKLTVMRPYWPNLRTLVLQPDPQVLSASSLKHLHSHLLARKKLGPFEYKKLLLFTEYEVEAGTLEAFYKLQRGFPQLSITMHTHSTWVDQLDVIEEWD